MRVAVPATRALQHAGMFGNKDAKQSRLERLAATVREASAGISQAELARTTGVTRSTITKDMGVIEEATGELFYEEDGRLFWFSRKGGRRA